MTATRRNPTRTRPEVVRGGWSRTRLPVTSDMVVLDIGSGTFPNPRADLLCERDLVDNRHRGGLQVVVDRPLVLGDALAIPLRDQAVDFVIASHIAEHIDEPVRFCEELARVARAGYIETPSPFFEHLFDVEYHSWIVARRRGELVFRRKRPRPAWVVRLTGPVYRLAFADQPSPNRPTYRFPDGALGRACRVALRVVLGLANRSGIMHTRVHFSPDAPLRCRVDAD